MTRLADTRPPYCAACFQRPADLRCVDFEAAYDGPVVPGQPEPVPVDDLVICERCLSEAFAILDPQGLKETIAELEKAVLAQAEEIRAKDKAVKGAKFTISELERFAVQPIEGKPALIGVSEEVRKVLTRGLYERRGTSAAAKNPRRGPRKAKQPENAPDPDQVSDELQGKVPA